MASLSLLEISQKLADLNLRFADYPTLAKITNHSNKNTLYKIGQRLIKKGVLKRLTDGKFSVSSADPADFEIANFIYQPSYISLETALSFYGILSQFTYSTTSVTTARSKKLAIGAKEYVYSRLKDQLFWGYSKQDTFLIADREKALLDTIYLKTKGLASLDYQELDLSTVDRKKLRRYASFFANKQLKQEITKLP